MTYGTHVTGRCSRSRRSLWLLVVFFSKAKIRPSVNFIHISSLVGRLIAGHVPRTLAFCQSKIGNPKMVFVA